MNAVAETADRMEETVCSREGKYLTFSLASEEYGIGILKIKEIIGTMPITPVPGTPDFIKGVINLRGKVIPVIDLRLRFGMEPADYDEHTCIIVVEIEGTEGLVLMGVVVDEVSEVMNIREDETEDTPAFGSNINTEYILGMAKKDGKVKILLDIGKVLSPKEISALQNSL